MVAGRGVFLLLAGLGLAMNGCMEPTRPDLLGAVLHRQPEQVALLVRTGAPLNPRDESGDTPLTLATISDQFVIAEMLIDAGADIFAASEFGWTAGYAAQTSRLEPGTAEGDARQRVIAKLKAKGFPWPAPEPETVEQLAAKGQWPPAR